MFMLERIQRVCVGFVLACVAAEAAHGANFVVTQPFKIQAAIDAALASGDVADVIFVNPGIYDEALVIDFSGTSQESLYLIHNTSVRPVVSGGITIRDSRIVTIDGFAIRSSKADTQAAAIVRDTIGAAFVQCVFDDGDFGGIDAADSFEIVVNDCTFGSMDESVGGSGGYGVKIVGGCGHRVLSSDFKDDEGRSIWIEADRSEVSSTVVDGAGGDAGIYLEGLLNLVKSTTSKNNDGDGVRVIGTCEVSKSTLQNGVNDGSNWTGGSVRNSTIKGNDAAGIFVDDGQNGVEIKSNKIQSNSGAGVRLKGDRCSVRDNDIEKTTSGSLGGNGVLVDSSSDGNCIRSNEFSGNSGNAVRVEGDDNYVFLNEGSGGDGFIDSGSGNAGRDNQTSGPNDFD
jgi:parallel beta-helix repeat protein